MTSMEAFPLEVQEEMQSLHIHDKKRRLSGLFKFPDLGPESSSSESEEEPTSSEQSEPTQVRRSNRKKIRPLVPEEVAAVPRPRKLNERSTVKEIENYYRDRRVKRVNLSLETIYEEPQVIRDKEVVMGSRKFRRVINFSGIAAKNSSKIKKRKNKAKLLTKKKLNKKITLKYLMEKLAEIADE